ncbi:hypothetical protein Sjap_012855 [Stephania japonica]|uniref:Uncharacterized protein n=1 Tax=Stephania japonica TaxID=461633 RepID=A0AAP0IWZ1_9MAGN
MSTTEARKKELCRGIDEVQNLIERCLQLYMSQKEVVEILLDQAKIEPDLTNLVWQKLVEENQEFFKAYHIRLMAKHQIMVFNGLLQKQVELMLKMHGGEVAIQPILGVPESSYFYSDDTLASWSDKMRHQAGISTMTGKDWMAMHSSNDATVHPGRFDGLSTMPLSDSQLAMIKSESSYSPSSALAFGNDRSIHEVHPTSNEPVPFHANAGEDSLLKLIPPDIDNSIFGFLGPLRKFGPSDLADDSPQELGEHHNLHIAPLFLQCYDEILNLYVF